MQESQSSQLIDPGTYLFLWVHPLSVWEQNKSRKQYIFCIWLNSKNIRIIIFARQKKGDNLQSPDAAKVSGLLSLGHSSSQLVSHVPAQHWALGWTLEVLK